MPLTLTDGEGNTSTVTGEDYKAQQAEAGAHLVHGRPTRETKDMGTGYRSTKKVWGEADSNGTSHAIYMPGDLIPEDEARRQGLIPDEPQEPEASPEAPAVEVAKEVKTEKVAAPKRTSKTTKPKSKE